MEEKINNLSEKLATMDVREFDKIVGDIAKKTKTKRLTSGTMFFRQYCKSVAEAMLKPSTESLIAKYNLA